VPGIREIVGEYPVGFVLARFPLEAIEGPICPIDIRLLQISHQVKPRSIPSVVTELSQEIRYFEAPNIRLSVEQFLSELLVAVDTPGGNRPRKPIEMTRVYQLIWDTELDGFFLYSGQIKLVIEPSDEDEPVWRIP
jgi:hypothetical protein